MTQKTQQKPKSDIMILKQYFGCKQVLDDDGAYRTQTLKEFTEETSQLSKDDKVVLANLAREDLGIPVVEVTDKAA